MTLKEIIKKEFNVDLPIKGGMGNSIDNAVIIEYDNALNDYVGTEYEVLKYIGLLRGLNWKIIQQSIMVDEGKTIDKMIIATSQMEGTSIVSQQENHYFDITDCFGKQPKKIISEEEDRVLNEMKEFLNIMNKAADDDKK